MTRRELFGLLAATPLIVKLRRLLPEPNVQRWSTKLSATRTVTLGRMPPGSVVVVGNRIVETDGRSSIRIEWEVRE